MPYVGLGMIGFGWGCAGDLSMAYLMDAYPEMVLEGMVGVAVINNTLACIFTFTASESFTRPKTNRSNLNLTKQNRSLDQCIRLVGYFHRDWCPLVRFPDTGVANDTLG
jgi:hypothetical protein